MPGVLTRLLVSVVKGLGNQTHECGHEAPQTTFLLTVNFTLEGDMQ